jgi:hypothetical protein
VAGSGRIVWFASDELLAEHRPKSIARTESVYFVLLMEYLEGVPYSRNTSSGAAIMSVKNRFFELNRFAAFIMLSAVLLVNPVAFAHGQAAPAAQASSPEIHAILEKVVHPKKVKSGDEVVARMTESTKLKDGTELPKGTKIIGKVTEVKIKADKEGPSKLGLLFDKAQLKDGKEIPLTMALVSVAPRWEQGGVDPVAAENTGSSVGRVQQMSQQQEQSSAGNDTLNKGLGIRGATSASSEDMRPGVCYVPDMTIASYSMGEPGTIVQSSKTTVYLDSGSRFLLLAQ